jgi:hypothetical protein
VNEDFEFNHIIEQEPSGTDPAEQRARQDLIQLFEKQKDSVFFSRQLEVMFEEKYFHWITNRALRYLVKEGPLKERRDYIELWWQN